MFFLEHFLVPVFQPGGIVVMDNVRTNKVAGVNGLIEEAGATITYEHPYSPDLNPIELLWAFAQDSVRAWGRGSRPPIVFNP
jgi:transposase